MNKSEAAVRLSTISVALVVAGCGGGGGEVAPPVVPAVQLTLDQIQGFWGGALDSNTTAQAVILRDGQIWIAVASGGKVQSVGRAQGAVGVGGISASGVLTDVTTGASQSLDVLASSVTTATVLGVTVSTPQVGTRGVAWTYNPRFNMPLPVADFAGQWTGTAGQQRVAATWNITSSGSLTGTSTTGCTYVGTLTPQAQPVAVLNVGITEACPGLPSIVFTGIATMNEARTQTSYLLSYPGGAQYSFVAMQK